MNMLVDKLPTSVEIEGVVYPVNWGHRTFIQFEILLQGEEDDRTKIIKGLELFYGKQIPTNVEAAVNALIWFYRCGEEEKHLSSGELTYSFDYDASYIFAAFKDQYKVDLSDEEMHWWKFRAMFMALSDNTKISEIIGYRSIKLDKEMTKGEKEFYKKMKQKYKLPISRTKTRQSKLIIEALERGESLDSIE